jgi:hypothetical protein
LLNISVADMVSVFIVVLSGVNAYLAYSIAKITNGAPRAWYVIIIAFIVLMAARVTQLYFDVLSPMDLIDFAEAVITLSVIILFAVGLTMLRRTFRRQLKVAKQGSDQFSP